MASAALGVVGSRSTQADFVRLQPLGQGSFGRVYKARRKADGQHYVLKHVALSALSPAEQRLAVEEVRILARFDSPHVVRYYDAFVEAGELVIVMEWCERGDLHNWIRSRRGPPPEEDAWRVLIQAACGLHELHAGGVLHRDLKAANLFLAADGRVKIGDLGVAKVLGSRNFARTTVGTPYYLSPELCDNRPYNDRSDVWSLGCVAYELCTGGRRPFDARSAGALVVKIMKDEPPPLPSSLSSALRRAIAAMLAKNPRRRPTVGAFLAHSATRAWAAKLGMSDELPRAVASAPRQAERAEGREADAKQPTTARRRARGRVRCATANPHARQRRQAPAQRQATALPQQPAKPTVGEFKRMLCAGRGGETARAAGRDLPQPSRPGPVHVRARSDAAEVLGLAPKQPAAASVAPPPRPPPPPPPQPHSPEVRVGVRHLNVVVGGEHAEGGDTGEGDVSWAVAAPVPVESAAPAPPAQLRAVPVPRSESSESVAAAADLACRRRRASDLKRLADETRAVCERMCGRDGLSRVTDALRRESDGENGAADEHGGMDQAALTLIFRLIYLEDELAKLASDGGSAAPADARFRL